MPEAAVKIIAVLIALAAAVVVTVLVVTNMTPGDALFYVFAVLTVVAAYFVVAQAEIVRAAIALLFALAGIAGLYLFLAADFLAVVQIIIYVGGIMVLVLFGIMLTKRGVATPERERRTEANRAVLGGLIGLGLFGLLYTVLVQLSGDVWAHDVRPAAPTSKTLGHLLLTDYLLPFEVASVLLLAALVGAAYIARRKETD